uniref:Natural cytotoxicity triggering receptor 3 n=1 Tax=Molossus molossus TaxID=27622 RepID=A0A7J8GRT1_MOLMO|nr:natural cytotoxicity triggering receptor 3 [Molossus molossus]
MKPQNSGAAWPLLPLPASSVTTRLSCTSGTPEAVTLGSTCAEWRCWARAPAQGAGLCWWWRRDLLGWGPSQSSSFGLDSMPSAFSPWPWAAPSITKARVSHGALTKAEDMEEQ